MYVTRILVLSCLLCGGCSAFRWGERSYQEVEERNLQQRTINRMWFKDDTAFSGTF